MPTSIDYGLVAHLDQVAVAEETVEVLGVLQREVYAAVRAHGHRVLVERVTLIEEDAVRHRRVVRGGPAVDDLVPDMEVAGRSRQARAARGDADRAVDDPSAAHQPGLLPRERDTGDGVDVAGYASRPQCRRLPGGRALVRGCLGRRL